MEAVLVVLLAYVVSLGTLWWVIRQDR